MRSVKVLVVVLLLLLVLPMGAALAQDPYPPQPPDVGAGGLERGPAEDVGGVGQAGGLPFTGAQLTLFVVAGLGMIVLGTIAVRTVRSKKGSTPSSQ